MKNRLKKARANLIKEAEELDKVSRCYHAKKKKAITTIVKAVLEKYYKY